ncbi:MAG: DUF4983 domain-containing protein [Bacteroidetes bacterium]|nr:DUF4983 domain-containing protein [Bacteroidota bacterium]
MTKKLSIGFTGILAGILFLVVPSCKKYTDPPPYFEDSTVAPKPIGRKVLVIAIDGAQGTAYKAIAPPVLTAMEAHSKFSWEGFSDEKTTDAASWETLMTGVSYSKHGIFDSSFIFSQSTTGDGPATIANYSSMFSYVLSSARADMKTSFISQWNNLLLKLVPQVQDPVLATSDAAVKDSAISRIKNPKSDFITVDFNSVAIAGKAGSFSDTDPGYKAAVLKIDGYIGELMAALKSRPEYNKSEEWLVVVTGTHGGVNNTYGGPTQPETNVVSFYYNENFKQIEFVKSGSFSGVQITGTGNQTIKGQVLNDGGIYDPGTGEQTIQLKVNGSAGYYPHFFSKMASWPSTPGWSMFSSGGNWNISVISTTSSERRIQGSNPIVFDNTWHTITVVFADSASKKWVRRYTDGNRIDQTDITSSYNSSGSITSTSPLTVGWGADPGMPAVTFYTADIMIFNSALNDSEIKNNICLTDITKHPEYAHLIGYWPANDGYGGQFQNKAPGQNAGFTLTGSYKWNTLSNYPCTTTPSSNPSVTSMVVKNVDLFTNLFYWLKIPTNSSWNLEGANWLQQYEIEFVK